MSTAETPQPADDVVRPAFDRLRAAADAHAPPPLAAREQALDRMLAWIREHRDAVCHAIDADFGSRSRHETLLAEVLVVANAIRHTRKHLRRWARPERRSVFWALLPARAEVQRQPLGVVGIIGPWNYPFHLAVLPLVAAVAAGNRVLVKPSELTPRTSDLVTELVREVFDRDHVDVVTGGPEIGAVFSALPFDHLFFTGSTRVGRLVARAAADNLTPVTLELGGKSPVIVHPDYDLDHAADRVAYGKLLNAGQTCVAPDYVLVGPGRARAFADAFARAVARQYPRLLDNEQYTSIVNQAHRDRLLAHLQDARERGATVIDVDPAGEGAPQAGNKLLPAIVLGATEEMTVLQEELFGPVLPVIEVQDTDAAIRYVNARPRPLALYVFDDDAGRVQRVLDRTTSGGALVNDTMLHVGTEDLPFGGVGESGMGAYHGVEGFRTFSHEKAVFRQSRLARVDLISPPYGRAVDRLLSWLI